MVAGIGTVCDLLDEGVTTRLVIFGEAEDQDRGVVVFVDALQGLEEVVNWVEGLLMLLIDEDAGLCIGTLLAARACNSGMSRGGNSAGGYVAGLTRTDPS